ncbi:MAG: C4-dicarboxylate ABC transporter permease [Deltaproteobacteria bacterium]|jgi:putative tricarboxylic transport membrane protein|nr:C4-dicarboxylate ABC transporter permease [Deltaproteobacteria bacterium]
MDLINNLLLGFSSLAGWQPILIIVAGVILGIIAGAMPGLSPSTAVALLVPFSYTMEPGMALILLTSIYIASNYGGSITAVLINTPGTPSAAVTTLDGYPLTQKGEAGKGLGTALVASTIGGAVGVLILILFAVPLAKIALQFSSADYFALALFGLATVASMGSGNIAKALIAILFGLLIKTIGIDPISGVSRFTFGMDELYDGFNLIPALIGLFAVSVVFAKVEEWKMGSKGLVEVSNKLPSFSEFWKIKMTILRSSVIGTIIGIFPGAGATIASFISYDVAKRSSKTPEQFGKGSLEGVAAAEGANSSSVGGALVPLLALGIPGSATDAVLLGAFMLHDLNPGPLLFRDSPEIVYGIFTSLILANIIMLILGLYGNRAFIKVVSVPAKIMYPMILAIAIIGSFAVNGSLFDVAACIGFGVIGWLFKRFGYPVAPVVLGIVLGKMIEENYRRAVMMHGYSSFFMDKVSLVMLSLAAISFIYPIIKQLRKKNK